jgi:hypothetical protein
MPGALPKLRGFGCLCLKRSTEMSVNNSSAPTFVICTRTPFGPEYTVCRTSLFTWETYAFKAA